MASVGRMRVSTGTVIGAAVVVAALGGCGAANNTAAPPSTVRAVSDTTAPRSTTGPSITTIPTIPPTTKAPPTTAAPTTTSPPTATSSTTTTTASTTTTPPTTAPPTTAPPATTPATTAPPTTAGAPPCTTAQLTADLRNGQAAAGTFYYQLTFRNTAATPCSMFGYPGVSYVRGSTGIQTGDPADRIPSISGQHSASVVTLAAGGGEAHAVVAEVDLANYSRATCRPVPVRGLRVYPPNQGTALFVPQNAMGCASTGVYQLGVGFVVA